MRLENMYDEMTKRDKEEMSMEIARSMDKQGIITVIDIYVDALYRKIFGKDGAE